MVSGDSAGSCGWFDWAYEGVDHSFPGNGGVECRDFLSISQRWWESIVACTLAMIAIIYAWPRMKLPKSCPCVYERQYEPLGKRILLLLMCLTFGIELGFKFATRQMIWVANPCHLATIIQIVILAAPPSRVVTAAFRLHLHMLTGAPIAILFPVINTRLLPFETGVYFVQHGLMLVIPFYLMLTGDPYLPEALGDFSWALTGFGIMFIYHFIPLQLLAYVSQVNLNNMLCPAVSDPFHGQYYRVFAIGHQFILILILGKIIVIIAQAFKILPLNNCLDVANVCSCAPDCACCSTLGCLSCSSKEDSPAYNTKCLTEGESHCADAIHEQHKCLRNSGYNFYSRCCRCGGDNTPLNRNIYSFGSDNTDYSRDFCCEYCNPVKFSTQFINNSHLITNENHSSEYEKIARKRQQDVSDHKTASSETIAENYRHGAFTASGSQIISSESDGSLSSPRSVSDLQKSRNGHAKSH